MNILTCKTCKHWNRDCGDAKHSSIVHPTDPDTWEEMVMPFLVGECSHPEKLFCERPLTNNGFSLADGSEYMASLYTGEDFGCVRHELLEVKE